MPISPSTFFRAPRVCAVLTLLTLSTVVACARPQVPVSRALPVPSAIDHLAGGATLALPRPTPDVAWLSLWLATGARDGAPPQGITAAAWLVAERAGADARVEPDATELRMQCDVANGGLKACVERLGRAVTRRDVSESEATRLRERLQSSRLRAATDHARRADERALRALLSETRGFFPLGDAADDAKLTARAIEDVISRHMRIERSILIAAGDVDDGELDRAFARFRPRGNAPALSRKPAPALRSELSVEEDDQGSLAFAMATPDVPQAAAIAERIEIMYAGATTRVARMPSFALLHVRMPAGEEPFARLQRAVFDLRRLALELPRGDGPPRDDSLAGLTRELGELWIARDAEKAALSLPWPLGIAVTLRAPAMPIDDKDGAARRTRLEGLAQNAIAAGEANALGPLSGRADANGADLTVPNGVRIRVQRKPGDRWLGAVLRIEHGSRDDPDNRHGRAALLATWLSNGCGFAHGRALNAHLNAIDAHVAPLVNADASGVRITAPTSHWQDALDTLLRCAVRPATNARAIEDARVRLLAALTEQQGPMYDAFAAEALSAATPGFVARWGTPLGVSSVSAAELRRLHREVMQGARLTVAVGVDADPGEVARFISRRVAQLEGGTDAAPIVPAVASTKILGELQRVAAPRAVIALRADGDARGCLAPAVVAHALATQLGKRLGQPIWNGGAGNSALAYGAVAIGITETELESVPPMATTLLQELARRNDDMWRSALREAQLERSAQSSDASGWADAAFEQRPQVTLAEELALTRRLLLATPHFVVLRPAP